MVKKILVTGFPHCGTTILRAKIGECENTHEQVSEFPDPQHFHPNMQYDFYVYKHPYLHAEFRNSGFVEKANTKFSDTIVIPIIRNPWNVFSSIYKKSMYDEKTTGIGFSMFDGRQGLSFPYYENAGHRMLEAFENNYEDVYPIKYEDMFLDNFKILKDIFDKVGLKYNNDIFENRTKNYQHNNSQYSEKIEFYGDAKEYNELYRAWQINQPFENRNSDITLPDGFSELLEKSEIIKKLGYSDPRITH
jgi:hypothetical protein